MKRFSLAILFFVSLSVLGSKTGHASPFWMDEMTVFCTATIEWNGGPIDVRGTKDICIPSFASFCNFRICEALTRPVQ